MQQSPRKPRNTGRRTIWAAAGAAAVLGLGAVSVAVDQQNTTNLARMKAIADRLQTGPGWERDRSVRNPSGGAFCVPIDGPCAVLVYRWDTHEPYRDGDLERFAREVGVPPGGGEPCTRVPRFNAGGLDCSAVGEVDGWDVRITISDTGPAADSFVVQVAVEHYGY
jgi:hypothetical protein